VRSLFYSIAALHCIFQKSGLEYCEEQVHTLGNSETRENLNLSVVLGIQHALTAAFNLHKLDEIQTIDQIIDLKEAILSDLHNVPCYYSFDVYVVVGRKA
jgi:hypothetical protein